MLDSIQVLSRCCCIPVRQCTQHDKSPDDGDEIIIQVPSRSAVLDQSINVGITPCQYTFSALAILDVTSIRQFCIPADITAINRVTALAEDASSPEQCEHQSHPQSPHVSLQSSGHKEFQQYCKSLLLKLLSSTQMQLSTAWDLYSHTCNCIYAPVAVLPVQFCSIRYNTCSTQQTGAELWLHPTGCCNTGHDLQNW